MDQSGPTNALYISLCHDLIVVHKGVICRGYIGLCRDNGKENENYHSGFRFRV